MGLFSRIDKSDKEKLEQREDTAQHIADNHSSNVQLERLVAASNCGTARALSPSSMFRHENLDAARAQSGDAFCARIRILE